MIVLAISTSSVISTGYAKKISSNVFSESETVQASDANQNIIERIANLQKQINELKRQIATLPGGGEAKDLVSEVVTVPADTHDVSNQIHEGTAHCPEGKVITGGGFKFPTNSIAPLLLYDGPGTGQSWTVRVFQGFEVPVFSVFAVCAGLE